MIAVNRWKSLTRMVMVCLFVFVSLCVCVCMCVCVWVCCKRANWLATNWRHLHWVWTLFRCFVWRLLHPKTTTTPSAPPPLLKHTLFGLTLNYAMLPSFDIWITNWIYQTRFVVYNYLENSAIINICRLENNATNANSWRVWCALCEGAFFVGANHWISLDNHHIYCRN